MSTREEESAHSDGLAAVDLEPRRRWILSSPAAVRFHLPSARVSALW